MAIHLLRTLESNHNTNSLVGEHLVPCCGHHIDHLDKEENVHIQGCMTGFNFWVEHKNEMVFLTTENGTKEIIPFAEYKDKVIQFADKVEQLYVDSKQKNLPKDEYDRKGYKLMQNEWRKRREKWN